MDDDIEKIREKKLEEMKKRVENASVAHKGIVHVTQENMESLIRDEENLVIDFWAPWCGPCRMLGPVIEELSVAYAGKVSFGKCNTDENQQVAYQLGISAIPTLHFYKNGKLVHQIAGALPRPQLEAQIRTAFQIA